MASMLGDMEEDSWDVVVVGGGPAGLSAALMLGRARRRVLVIDAGEPRNRFAAHMHGVLGHEGIDPGELIAAGRDEVTGYGVEFRAGAVERIDETDDGVTAVVEGGAVVRGRIAVVATGLRDGLPDVPGLAERWGSTVLHCPYCHGWEVRDQRLGVLATSPFALHQAELVRQWSDRVVVFTAGMGAVEPAAERRLRSRGIELVPAPVVEITGAAPAIDGVRTGDGQVVPVDAIFTMGDPHPHEDFLAHLGLDRADGPMGSVLAVDATGKTSSDRIWAIGNVVNPGANVPMAIGAGAMAGGMVNMALVTGEFDAAEEAIVEVPR